MVVMRHPNPGAAMFLSKHVDASIVNAGDGAHEHPTQALLDCFSIRKSWGYRWEKGGYRWRHFTFSSCIVKYFCSEKTRCGGDGLWPTHTYSQAYRILGSNCRNHR